MTSPGHLTPETTTTQPRRIAEEIKENAGKLLEEGLYCIFDWQDLRDLINNSELSPKYIPPGSQGQDTVRDELNLRESSLKRIKDPSSIPIILVGIDSQNKAVEELTLPFFINSHKEIRLPDHEAFPDDPEIRTKVNQSFGKIAGWLS